MHGTDRTLRSELGEGGAQTHKDVYDSATGQVVRIPVGGTISEAEQAPSPEHRFLAAVEAEDLLPVIEVSFDVPIDHSVVDTVVKAIEESPLTSVNPTTGESCPTVILVTDNGPLYAVLVEPVRVRWQEEPR